MISGGRFIAGGGKFPDGWGAACGGGAVLVWGGELDSALERAGTSPANRACKSTLLGSAAAAADDGSAVEALAFAGKSFTFGAGGDIEV